VIGDSIPSRETYEPTGGVLQWFKWFYYFLVYQEAGVKPTIWGWLSKN